MKVIKLSNSAKHTEENMAGATQDSGRHETHDRRRLPKCMICDDLGKGAFRYVTFIFLAVNFRSRLFKERHPRRFVSPLKAQITLPALDESRLGRAVCSKGQGGLLAKRQSGN